MSTILVNATEQHPTLAKVITTLTEGPANTQYVDIECVLKNSNDEVLDTQLVTVVGVRYIMNPTSEGKEDVALAQLGLTRA